MVLKPTHAGLQRAAKLLRSGAVVAFPTDTVYGLGASADDEVAQKRIYQIKGRPVGMPLILMVAGQSQLEGLVHVDSRAEEMMRKWWPGPLTLILYAIGGGTYFALLPANDSPQALHGMLTGMADGEPQPIAALDRLLALGTLPTLPPNTLPPIRPIGAYDRNSVVYRWKAAVPPRGPPLNSAAKD